MAKRIPLRDRLMKVLTDHTTLLSNSGEMSDASCSWIEIRKPKNRIVLCIQFDAKGEEIQDIEVHKEIKKVVDQKKLF